MHPRNRYLDNPADFGELAEFRPSLKPFLIEKHSKRRRQLKSPPGDTPPKAPPSKGPDATPCKEADATHPKGPDVLPTKGHFAYTLDFSDPAALRELTCAVLEKDFDLKLEIPLDHLIPTIPQKLNYIHWVEDLLSCRGVASHESGTTGKQPIPNVLGIDVGEITIVIYL